MESVGLKTSLWKGRRVLVTGNTGFKGMWLTEWLRRLEASVVGYSLPPPTSPSLFSLMGRTFDGTSSIQGDVCDLASVSAAMRAARPDIVFHLAAQSLVRPSYEEPLATFATNVMGTANVLEAARMNESVRAVIIVTSDKCYENTGSGKAYVEEDPLGGYDPYSASKACAEIVAQAYSKSFFEGRGRACVATVRAGNVIGGGDFARDRLVPDAIRAFSSGEALLIRNPAATRPWQHVLEPLHGYLLLAERLFEGDRTCEGAWNFGPPATSPSLPVSWIVDQLVQRWGDGAQWDRAPGEHVYEAATLAVDPAKAMRHLQWAPRLPLTSALDWIVEFERGIRGGHAAEQLVADQLARFHAQPVLA